jgi:hypothetical protein
VIEQCRAGRTRPRQDLTSRDVRGRMTGTPPRSETEPSSAETATPGTPRTNKPVLIGSATVILAITLWAIIAPTQAGNVIGAIVSWVSQNLGWYYIVTAAIVVFFVIMLAARREGSIKLGPDHSKPQFNMFTWTSMLFAAGIGIDLMFFSVSEPVTQYYTPPGRGGREPRGRTPGRRLGVVPLRTCRLGDVRPVRGRLRLLRVSAQHAAVDPFTALPRCLGRSSTVGRGTRWTSRPCWAPCSASPRRWVSGWCS